MQEKHQKILAPNSTVHSIDEAMTIAGGINSNTWQPPDWKQIRHETQNERYERNVPFLADSLVDFSCCLCLLLVCVSTKDSTVDLSFSKKPSEFLTDAVRLDARANQRVINDFLDPNRIN